MIKRFNPDFSLSISHELAYMRETPEGGYVAHGDYATLFSELEVVKSERDRLQQLNEQTLQVKLQMAATIKEQSGRADALAVENAELKESAADLRKQAFNGRRNSHNCGPFQYSDLCESIIESTKVETPATSATLAAIQKQAGIEAVEEAAHSLYGKGYIFDTIMDYAAELREAK